MLSAKANRIVLNFLLLVGDWRQEIKHLKYKGIYRRYWDPPFVNIKSA